MLTNELHQLQDFQFKASMLDKFKLKDIIEDNKKKEKPVQIIKKLNMDF